MHDAIKWLLLALALFCQALVAAPVYDLDFVLTLDPKQRDIVGEMRLGAGADRVTQLRLSMDPKRYTQIDVSSGEIHREGKEMQWRPAGPGVLSYRVRVDELRGEGRYRARFAEDWAIFRADRVIPAAAVRTKGGASSRSFLRLELPEDWHQDTAYLRGKDGRYRIDNPDRRFDRPVGWMIAGRVGIRRDVIGGVEVAIAAPMGLEMRRMDTLVMLGHTLPEMKRAFATMPKKILIVAGPDPMWRGGLSAPGSLFLHMDRPLISENATSTMLHELTHVITRIRGKQDDDDWIAEGLAEYYGLQLLLRSGGITQSRYDKALNWLTRWSKSVKTLRAKRSTGPITARAVLLLTEVDQEIRKRSHDAHSLDDLVQELMDMRAVSTKQFIEVAERLAGAPLKALQTPLLEGK